MSESDPYRARPGPTLDRAIHCEILQNGDGEPAPSYSIDENVAREFERTLRLIATAKIVSGRSRTKGRLWFARYEDDPSTATEVLAETYPLAICRLALLCRGKLKVSEKRTLYSGALSELKRWYAGT